VNWPFVTRRRHERALTDQRAETLRVQQQLDAAEKSAEEQTCRMVRLCAEIDRLRDAKPDTPLSHSRPLPGDAEVRCQLHLARGAVASMDVQLRDLQSVNEAQAQELRAYAEKEATAL
jgi:hypothetical protein